jgi:methionyl-tRNA formyltransferase
MGTPAAAVPTLRRCLEDGHEIVAVWTQPDRPSGRGNKVAPQPVKRFATANNLIVHQPAKIRSEEAKRLFASHEAELAVVVAYGRILPPEFLRAPRRGCINVHFSLLPHYRGAAPVNWAIVNGETETGITTMFIEEQLDSGPILQQRSVKIGAAETAPELMARLANVGADLLSETLKNLDSITPQAQRHEEATFAPVLKKEDGLISWSADAAVIERGVRGFQPWPTAYTHHGGTRLIVWRAAVEDQSENAGHQEPGTVAVAHRDDLIVNAGSGTQLRLLEIQPEGKRRMSVRDFLNGTHLQAGEQLS